MTQSTGVGRSRNAPKTGQRGFAAHRDHYDRTGIVPPRSQQCQLPNCINPAIQDPKYRASYSLKLCEYHTDLVIRNPTSVLEITVHGKPCIGHGKTLQDIVGTSTP